MNNAISKALLLLICAIFVSSQITRGKIDGADLSAAQPSNATCPNCCSDKTISVGGSTVVLASPDKATLNAQLMASESTVNRAIDRLAEKVNQLIARLEANGLTKADYQATSINVYANTSWNDGVSKVLGQIANQNFAVNLPTISPDGSNIGRLIDSLAQIDGITINSLTFDIKDKTAILTTARERAFRQAQRKAEDYAGLLALKVGKVVSITDSYSSAPVVQYFQSRPQALAFKSAGDSSQGTAVNVGNVRVAYDLSAVYAFSA